MAILRNTALHPFRTLAGALRLSKIHLLEGAHLEKLPTARQRTPDRFAYKTIAGMGVFKVGEELLARANLTGQTSVSNVNGAHMVVRPGARLDDVHTDLHLQLADPYRR